MPMMTTLATGRLTRRARLSRAVGAACRGGGRGWHIVVGRWRRGEAAGCKIDAALTGLQRVAFRLQLADEGVPVIGEVRRSPVTYQSSWMPMHTARAGVS